MQQTFDAVVVGSGPPAAGWRSSSPRRGSRSPCSKPGGGSAQPRTTPSTHPALDAVSRPAAGGARPAGKQPVQSRCYQCDEYANHLFIDDTEHPYTTRPTAASTGSAGGTSAASRLCGPGSRTASATTTSRRRQRDSFGEDWPLSYEELAPYYDQVERFIGISGQAEGLPQLPDSQFLPPMALTCGEEILKKAIADRYGRTLTIGRAAVLTRALNGRPACHYCAPAGAAAAPARTTAARTAAACRGGDRPPDAHPRCRRQPRHHRRRGAVHRRLLRGSADAQPPRGGRPDRRPLRLDAGVDADHVELHFEPPSERDRQLQRRARALSDGPRDGRRRVRHPAGAQGRADTRGNRPNGIYIPRFRNVETRESGFLRGYGFQGRANLSKWGHANSIPASGRRSAPREGGAALADQPRRLRRMPAAVREPLPARPRAGRRLGHSNPPHQRRLRRQRAADGGRHGRYRHGNAGKPRGRRTSPARSRYRRRDWPVTRWARRAWATTPPRRCSTAGSRRTT